MITPRDFFRHRLDGLCAEVGTVAALHRDVQQDFFHHAAIVSRSLDATRSPDLTDSELGLFDSLLRLKAHVVLRDHLVADSYRSMGEFWSAVEMQAAGKSAGTYWDSYEHGRRRQLEQRLAAAYGSPAALLVNSGMSAIYCGIRALAPSHGHTVLAHDEAYFETRELYDTILGGDLDVRRRNLTTGRAIRELRREVVEEGNRPLFVAESATNAPAAVTLPLDDDVLGPATLVLDNSTLSHGMRYEAVCKQFPSARVVVVESGSKYLTGMASVGVVYGAEEEISKIRLWSRRTGQQLQAAAFAYLNEVDIDLAEQRVAIHSRAAAAFASAIDPRVWHVRRPGDSATGDGGLPALVRRHGSGALVFLAHVRGHDQDLVDRWASASTATPRAVRIQAGFGWSWSSARAYTGSFLNQAYAPNYLRVSLGVLSEAAATEQAEELNRVTQQP